MKVQLRESEAALICRLSGDLDHKAKGVLESSASRVVGRRRVVFDLSDVRFVDSAGLAGLLGTVRRVRGAGGDAVVCSPRTSVRRMLEAVLLTRTVNLVDDMAAVSSYFSRPIAA